MALPLAAIAAKALIPALMPAVTQGISKFMNFVMSGGILGGLFRKAKRKKEANRFANDFNKMVAMSNLSPQQKLAMKAQGFALQQGIKDGKIGRGQAMAMMQQMGQQYNMTNQMTRYFADEMGLPNPNWNLLNSYIDDPALHYSATNLEAMFSMNW